MLERLAALQHQHFQSFLGQLLRGPAAGHAGAHDDGIEIERLHVFVLFSEWGLPADCA
jgi:hypothetical protein